MISERTTRTTRIVLAVGGVAAFAGMVLAPSPAVADRDGHGKRGDERVEEAHPTTSVTTAPIQTSMVRTTTTEDDEPPTTVAATSTTVAATSTTVAATSTTGLATSTTVEQHEHRIERGRKAGSRLRGRL